MESYGYSPYSSTGNADSIGGTPDTRITAFSPEDPRVPRSASMAPAAGVFSKEGQHDPFVIVSNSKATTGLSATASAFRPVGRNISSGSASIDDNSSPPVPGTAQYLSKLIADSTPPRTKEASDGVKFGTFTTDTGASRCIKISGIYDKMVQPAVQASLDVSRPIYDLNNNC